MAAGSGRGARWSRSAYRQYSPARHSRSEVWPVIRGVLHWNARAARETRRIYELESSCAASPTFDADGYEVTLGFDLLAHGEFAYNSVIQEIVSSTDRLQAN